jgi:hypothetical protein
MASLESHFQSSPIYAHIQSEIIEQFWGPNAFPKQLHNGEASSEVNLDSYFNFTFWHDRLVILKQVFDETRPSTLSQWWSDRCNGVQWYAFWVAILVLALTIVFGFVQCVEGALQVYKAFHPT